MSEHTCTPGHEERCATATSATCRCACGGHNHGNPAAVRGPREELPMLTDTRIFEPEWVESPGGGWKAKDYRDFIDGAEHVAPINCVRHEAGALVDIPQRWVVHSPTGFEWGYGGSGPADLALNVLGLFVPPPEAWRLHQRFKWAVIARIPREGGVIEPDAVRAWIADQWWAQEGAETAP